MLTTCIPTRHCNTHAPGWLFNGTHPELHEGIVPRRVCFHWSNDCCYFKTNIRVRSCGSFYAYELGSPSGCQLRYCGEWRLPQLQSNFACMQTLPSAGKFQGQYKLQALARVTYRNVTCKLIKKLLLFSFLNAASGSVLAGCTCFQQWRRKELSACIIESLDNARLPKPNMLQKYFQIFKVENWTSPSS